jgi:hypothetical protein
VNIFICSYIKIVYSGRLQYKTRNLLEVKRGVVGNGRAREGSRETSSMIRAIAEVESRL